MLLFDWVMVMKKHKTKKNIPLFTEKDLIAALKESEEIIKGKKKVKLYHNVNDLIKDLENE